MPSPNTPSGGLQGYAVIVTGGGTGIGRACAARLVSDGAAVTICGRTEASLRASVEQLDRLCAHGGSIRYVVADVTHETDIERLVATAATATGALNACIANAGGGGMPGPLHVQDAGEFMRVLQLNVLGTFLLLKHTIPRLVSAGGGSFVGMSSLAGSVTHRFFGAYPAAKAGIEQLCRNAADEYGPAGVRCNAIRPGFIATEIMEGVALSPEVYDSYIRNTPMGGAGQPADVAALARFLVGPESRWITGTVIEVDGGHHLRAGPDFGAFVEPMFGKNALLARS